ncbi:MAG: all-trans-retinol 13,14-reductase [Planctomycetota bacterium]|jgi:all-trans-retinol 13,14-reductase
MVHSDVVIIGAGISGLVDAILMAETGKKVTVLEQHVIPGGFLQQFSRKKTVFDVGFHYMGSTSPGRPMRQFLEHLKIWDKLRVLPLPEDSAIEVQAGSKRFGYPLRFASFHEKALATWPSEREAIEKLVADTAAVCAEFKWFALKKGREYEHPMDLPFPPISLAQYLGEFVKDPWLREVLEFQTFNLGLFANEIPWTKHLLAFRSNFDETSRIDGGGGALVDALVARGKELGVDYHYKTDVVRYECEGRQVQAAITAKGERYEAGLFIAACHPKVVLAGLSDKALKPMFKDRVFEMKDSRGAFQLFLRLKQPLDSLKSHCLMLSDEEEWQGNPPLPTILVINPLEAELQDRGSPRLEAMTYFDHSLFEAWSDKPLLKRGGDYEAFKAQLADRVIAMITKICPELPSLILDRYTSTPLTDASYTRASGGGVFGVSHDLTQQGKDRPQPRTRLKNLFFTGHSIMMPGICGVFINAFDTCEMLRGDDSLFESVGTE